MPFLAFRRLSGSGPILLAKRLSFETPAAFDIKGTVDTAIDGSSTAGVLKMTGKLTGTSTVQQEDMKIKVELNIEMSGPKERSEEK